jgi:hypothetical protein
MVVTNVKRVVGATPGHCLRMVRFPENRANGIIRLSTNSAPCKKVLRIGNKQLDAIQAEGRDRCRVSCTERSGLNEPEKRGAMCAPPIPSKYFCDRELGTP